MVGRRVAHLTDQAEGHDDETRGGEGGHRETKSERTGGRQTICPMKREGMVMEPMHIPASRKSTTA
jgi:hypothetical protein